MLPKILYLLLAVGASSYGHTSTPISFSFEGYAQLALQKDAGWYQQIAQNGYPSGAIHDGQQTPWAFFPLYPLLTASGMKTFGLSYSLSAFCWMLITSAAAIWGSFCFMHLHWKERRKAWYGTLVLFGFPFHFYANFFLTEGPFLAVLLWTFIAVHKKRFLWAGLGYAALTLLRPNGLVMGLPLVLYLLVTEHRTRRVPSSFYWKTAARMGTILLPGSLAFATWLGYNQYMTGNALAFSAAQAGWGKELMFPLLALFRKSNLNAQVTSTYVIILLFFLMVTWRKWVRNGIWGSFLCLVLLSLLLPLSAGSSYSIIRYLSVAFPLFMLLTELVYPQPWRNWALAAILVIGLGSSWFWITDQPLGF